MMTDQLSLSFEQDILVFYEEKNDTLIFSNDVNFITFLYIWEKYLNMLNNQHILLWPRYLYILKEAMIIIYIKSH